MVFYLLCSSTSLWVLNVSRYRGLTQRCRGRRLPLSSRGLRGAVDADQARTSADRRGSIRADATRVLPASVFGLASVILPAPSQLAQAEESGERTEEWLAYFTAAELAGTTADRKS